MESNIQKPSLPTLLVKHMQSKSHVTTGKRGTATKDQTVTLMVDPRLWSPLAGGIIIAIAPAECMPSKYHRRLVVMLRLTSGPHKSWKVVNVNTYASSSGARGC